MLRITAISAGSVEYLIKGSGCAEHEHAQELDAQRAVEASGVERSADHGVSVQAGWERGRTAGGADYYLREAKAGQLAAQWFGEGLAMVGAAAGHAATEKEVRAIFGQLRTPDSTVENPVFLGRPPRQFKSAAERVEAALAAEPDATPERRAELTRAAQADGKQSRAYYDLTFSPVKSVSVYWASLLAAGDHAGADRVRQTVKDATQIALRYAEEHAAYTRSGYHGKTKDGRSVGRYEEATGFVGLMWEHLTNREGEPQLHIHATVLNRVVTRSDGQVRALDGKSFRPIKEAIAAAFEAAVEDLMEERFPVAFRAREDGTEREILGIGAELRAAASTRRAQVEVRGAQMAAEYLQRHGRAPDAAAMKAIFSEATLETRRAKDSRAPLDVARAWVGRQPALAGLRERVAELAGRHRPAPAVVAAVKFDPANYREMVATAVGVVQAKYSSWTAANLVDEIKRLRPDLSAVPDGERPRARDQLAALALAPGNELGVLQLTAADPVSVPAELRRSDGRSVYRPHVDEKYCTVGHLASEEQVVVSARQHTAPALGTPELAMLEVELAARGLGPDQVAAVAGVLGSGRAGDVLIGPAGAGKSYTVGTLAQVWQERFAGRVLGLATSQIATEVLVSEGLQAMNTSVFLRRFTPNARGEVADRVRPGDLFVLDESGMSSQAEISRIFDLVLAGGGKVLNTGDDLQLGAPAGAGGMFSLLAKRNGAFELDTVRRFVNDWEGPASLRMRQGDKSVVAEYEARGRLRGGTKEEMHAAAVNMAVTDTLAGLRTLVTVSSNEDAQEVGVRIRARLIEHGKIEAAPVGRLGATGGHSSISVGDRVAARRNDRTMRIDPGEFPGQDMVVNREVYTVLGAGQGGAVRVLREQDGAVVHLSGKYLASDVSLAYAATVNAAQGQTVDTGLQLVDGRTRRESAYTGGTRGKLRNTFFVISRREPDEHEPERVDATPRKFLEEVLGREGLQRSATEEQRVGLEEGASLSVVGTIWNDVTAEAAAVRYSATLDWLLPAEQLEPMRAGREHDGVEYARLLRAVRDAEMAGHNAEALLGEAVGRGSLEDALSPADVLRWRVRDRLEIRDPEQRVEPGCWTALAPPEEGGRGQFQHDLAVRAEDRQTEIGAAAAEALPDWAVAHLGLPPVEVQAELQWRQKAGVLGAYREIAGVAEDVLSLGEAPSRERELHHALWVAAHDAIGRPQEGPAFARCSDVELREMQARYAREREWAPPAVAAELETAHTQAAAQRQESELTWAKAGMLAPGDAQYARLVTQAERAADMARMWQERADQLEPVHVARQSWSECVADIADRAVKAAAELRWRQPAEPGSELETPTQLELFPVPAAAAQDPVVGQQPERGQERVQEAEPVHEAEIVGTERSEQLTLFDMAPALSDQVAAGALRENTPERVGDEREREQAQATLAQARRQADAAQQQRELREQQLQRGEGRQQQQLLTAAHTERERRHAAGAKQENEVRAAVQGRDAELAAMAQSEPAREETLSLIEAGLRDIRDSTAEQEQGIAAERDYYQRSTEQVREQETIHTQELDQGYGLER